MIAGPSCFTCGAPVDAASCYSVPHPGAPWALLCDACFAAGPSPLAIAAAHWRLDLQQLRGYAHALRIAADRPALWSRDGAAARLRQLDLAARWDAAAGIVAIAIGIACTRALQVPRPHTPATCGVPGTRILDGTRWTCGACRASGPVVDGYACAPDAVLPLPEPPQLPHSQP